MYTITLSAGAVFALGMLAGILFSAIGVVVGAIASTKKNNR